MADPNSVQETIRGALMLVGALSQGEQPSNDEAQDAFNRLNDMMDSWSQDRLTIYTVQRNVFPMSSSQTYTLGPGGVWNTASLNPKIEEAYCQVTTSNPPSEIPVRIVETQEWARIVVKTTTSPIPRMLWSDHQYPLSTISLFPIPQGLNNMVLYLWQQLSDFSSLTSDIVFPPGYKLAIMYNLAEFMAPFYGRELSPKVLMKSAELLAAIKRRNLPEHLMECDLGTLAPSRVFNWLTGEAR